MITGLAISPNLCTMTFGTRNPQVADAGRRFSVISVPEVPPIRRGSALVRGRLPRIKFSLPSPRRKFLFRQKIFLADSVLEAIGSDRTHSDSGGLNRSPSRNCSATKITGFLFALSRVGSLLSECLPVFQQIGRTDKTDSGTCPYINI